MHSPNCHEGLSANNPNDMACMLAFVVVEIAFKVAVMTFSVAKIIFFWLRLLLKCL